MSQCCLVKLLFCLEATWNFFSHVLKNLHVQGTSEGVSGKKS